MALQIPPLHLNLNSTQQAEGRSWSAFDSSGFTVNYAAASVVGGGMPWGWLLAGALAVYWLRRKG